MRRHLPARVREAFANPKYEREARRSGRMPLTLIDGSTRANAARDLAAIAASIHAVRPCYGQLLQRAAQQIADSYTAASAVTNYATTPAANTTFTSITFAEPTFTEGSFTEVVGPS